MTTQWNHRTAKVNGFNIYYVTHGQGSPVILLHGWPEFWYSWRRVIPVLADQLPQSRARFHHTLLIRSIRSL